MDYHAPKIHCGWIREAGVASASAVVYRGLFLTDDKFTMNELSAFIVPTTTGGVRAVFGRTD